MDYRTVGLVAGYQGRRPASGWLPQILREFASITRSGAPHPRYYRHFQKMAYEILRNFTSMARSGPSLLR